MESLVYRLRKRAEIRRNATSRKSVHEGKPDRISDLLEEAANQIEGHEVSCKNCEKLKDALISLIQESDVDKLRVMAEYCSEVLKGVPNDDVERSLFAINILIEVLEEEQHEN